MEKNQKILTTIIPSYNTATFIDRCLSCYTDEYFIKKIDVFLIDDGPTDGITLKKCEIML